LYLLFFSQELLDLLKSANAGRGLLATYLKSGLLDSIGRKRLCNIIINKELQMMSIAKYHHQGYKIWHTK